MKLIQEPKSNFMHNVNNFVNESSDESNVKRKKNKNSWILDTSVIDHVNVFIHNLVNFAE